MIFPESSLELDTEERFIRVPIAPHADLFGNLFVPARAIGLVIFAHGSGSSRLSPRNRFVAAELQRAQLATLLIDLLTQQEEALDRYNGELRFDISLLASRLLAARRWALAERSTSTLRVGYFGASTGAAAALVAAAEEPASVSAIVSRGGRPDLAGDALRNVRAPVLLIVGGADREVLALNRSAAAQLSALHEIVVVPLATHLFEEPGALEQVAQHAGAWFRKHLPGPADALPKNEPG